MTPVTRVAAISVLMSEGRGAVKQAAVFSVCIMAVVIIALLVAKMILNLSGCRHITLIR